VILTCGNRDLWCRMYDSWKSVWEGFSKNAFGLVGFRGSVLFGLMLVCFLSFILPYVGVFIEPLVWLSAVAVFLNVALRFILSVKFDQPFAGVLLHPVAVALTILIGLNSYRWFKTGKVKWKGRRLEDGGGKMEVKNVGRK
jgi:chlorobactene glucosyltransferase